jgi:hypothetical protein
MKASEFEEKEYEAVLYSQLEHSTEQGLNELSTFIVTPETHDLVLKGQGP